MQIDRKGARQLELPAWAGADRFREFALLGRERLLG
jgi:hypothetical protein